MLSVGELLSLMVMRLLKHYQITNEFLNLNWEWKCYTEFVFHCPEFIIQKIFAILMHKIAYSFNELISKYETFANYNCVQSLNI